MREFLPSSLGMAELCQKHLRRLEKSRGGFGSWLPRLFDLSPRWRWLAYLSLYGRPPKEPYPQIHFVDDHDHQGQRLVEAYLTPFCDVGINELLYFLLHRFGWLECENLPLTIKSIHVDHWETFDLGAAIALERDFFGDFYSEVIGQHLRAGSGYFPTPMSVCQMIANMTLVEADLFHSVHDPCVGSGRMLLAASNRSLFLSGVDINPICIRMTLANGFLFAPQIVHPPPATLQKPNRKKQTIIPRETLLRLSRELHEKDKSWKPYWWHSAYSANTT